MICARENGERHPSCRPEQRKKLAVFVTAESRGERKARDGKRTHGYGEGREIFNCVVRWQEDWD